MNRNAELEWYQWYSDFTHWLHHSRGTSSRLARHLGVSRQRLQSWKTGTTMPGWAVIVIHNYRNTLKPLATMSTTQL